MKRRLWFKICLISLLLIIASGWFSNLYSWGFWGHKRINRVAVFTLPPGMIGFFKSHIEFVTENAVNPDRRRYAVDGEAPRHYIDLDYYGELPFDNVPRKWQEAVDKFSEDTLQAYGIVPWHVYRMMFWLQEAFEKKDKDRILRTATDLGHYIADAHVPLHTTLNYNGQLTGQHGIHGLWESRLPELLAERYDFFVGKAEYIDDPLNEIWEIVLESHAAVDSVLRMERELTAAFPAEQKFSFERRGENTIRTYSIEYSQAYHDMLDGMVERRMRQSIRNVGSFWYTAWVNAGQPDLDALVRKDQPEEEVKEVEQEEKDLQKGIIKSRPHAPTGDEIFHDH